MILNRRESANHSSFTVLHSPGPGHAARRVALAAAILFFLTGASEPEVIRVRVPAQDVSRWFPAGTELRVMTPAEFEAKVAAALKGSSLKHADRAPRLIRARHHAFVSSGVLVGRSELIIEPSPAGPAEFVLEPWSPAIVPSSMTAKVIGARSDGKTTLWIDQGSHQTLHLEWELQARRYSRGRGFVLRLPGGETSGLSLDDPQRLGAARAAEGYVAGQRLGRIRPRISGRSSLSLDGSICISMIQPGPAKSRSGLIPWLTSATEVDLRRGKRERGEWRTGRRSGGSRLIRGTHGHWKLTSTRSLT